MSGEAVKGKTLRCHHCGYSWIYKGRAKYYTSCPRCLYRVPVHKE